MDYKEAFGILEIDLTEVSYNDISLEYLKRQYRKMALKNHPDKNGNTIESNDKFKKINESYNFLKREIKNLEHAEDSEDSEDFGNHDYDANSSLYFDILRGFMKTVFDKKYNEMLSIIVNNIIHAGKKITIKLFDDLDKSTALNVYTFLSNHRSTLHLSEDILDKIRDIVVKKYDNVEVYKLNPSINDLMNNNLYKLYINNELFLVPLWHNESYFDSSCGEIIVICEPELPKGITIDDENNLYIETEISVYKDLPNLIIYDGFIDINIGDMSFDIPISELYMKKEQYYRIKNKGLSKIKKDIYDVSEKTDIIVKISIL